MSATLRRSPDSRQPAQDHPWRGSKRVPVARPEETHRACSRCGETRPIDQFRLHHGEWPARVCKCCDAERNRRWVSEHPEARKEIVRRRAHQRNRREREKYAARRGSIPAPRNWWTSFYTAAVIGLSSSRVQWLARHGRINAVKDTDGRLRIEPQSALDYARTRGGAEVAA